MQTSTVHCKNCNHPFTGKYCPRCGEKVYTDHDRTVTHFVEEGIHFFTHFEGTFFTTIKYIFTRPGKLSEDYCYGKRKSLFKPMSLFFLLVVVYLLFPVFEGLNMRLYYHLNGSAYSTYAKAQALKVMQAHHWNDEQLAEAYHKTSTQVSKFLLLVLLPLTASFFWALTFKRRPYFFDQMVFATEINSFYLIWGFLLLPLLLWLSEAVFQIITGNLFPVSDRGTALFIYAVMLVYLFLASKRFYRLNTGQALGLSVLFFLAHGVIVQIVYKFLLFAISMKLVH